jgi:hypothetical protein
MMYICILLLIGMPGGFGDVKVAGEEEQALLMEVIFLRLAVSFGSYM